VRHQNRGPLILGPDALKVEVHLVTSECVERAERLVQQEKRRVMKKGTTDSDPLTHPAGKFPRITVTELLEANLPKQ
jgi:hypothetical protein